MAKVRQLNRSGQPVGESGPRLTKNRTNLRYDVSGCRALVARQTNPRSIEAVVILSARLRPEGLRRAGRERFARPPTSSG